MKFSPGVFRVFVDGVDSAIFLADYAAMQQSMHIRLPRRVSGPPRPSA
jgi:hypothetical protein